MRGWIAALSVAAACLSAPASAYAQDSVYDPWESLNRRLFAAHEAIDGAVLEPVGRGYRAMTNEPVRQGVSNVLRNLRAPVIFANDVLQGEFGRAGTTVARFAVNTTVGVLGVMDPAERMGLERHDEDFGQTLARWGVEEGPYLFIPVLGPTNLRDGAGRIVDVGIDPITHAEFDGDDAFRISRTVVAGVAERESLIETVDGVRANSPDAYVTYRSSYALLRESAVRNGPADVQDLPEFEEIPQEPVTEPPEAPAPEPGAETTQAPTTPVEKIDEHLAVEDVSTM
jgi:phospholipid-binding lipoprotein MlaA